MNINISELQFCCDPKLLILRDLRVLSLQIQGVAAGLEGSIVLSQEPVAPQTLACASITAAAALSSILPGYKSMLYHACSYERSEVGGRQLSR